MNAYALYTVLRGMVCSQVKEAARDLGLATDGRKADCMRRILTMAADPVYANQVVQTVQDIISASDKSRRRRRDPPKPRAMRSLLADFDEAWAAAQAAEAQAAEAQAAAAQAAHAAADEAAAAVPPGVLDLALYMPTRPGLESPSHGPRVRDVL